MNVCSISLIFYNASLQIQTVLISGIEVQTDVKSRVQTYACMICSTHTHKHLRTFCDHLCVHKQMFTQIYLLINGPSRLIQRNLLARNLQETILYQLIMTRDVSSSLSKSILP
jgi:hypothetical protein